MPTKLIPHRALSALAQGKALGECVSVHPGEALSRQYGIYLIVIGALLAAVVLTDGAGVVSVPVIPGGAWAGVAMLVGGVMHLLIVMRRRSRILQIHEGGIVFRSGSDVALRWAEITSVFCTALISDTDGTYGRVELTTENGVTHKLSAFEGMGRIIDAAERETIAHLLNAAMVRVANGESIPFGGIILSAQGIKKDAVFKSWDEVKSVWETTEELTFTLRGQKEPWVKVMPHKMANYALLLALAKTLREGVTQPTGSSSVASPPRAGRQQPGW